tara:strand:- start:160 stop:594 length:435 start_codon:yes stop_codon:yes gene_type:complete
MGLDCYIVHGNDRDKAFTHEDDERIKNVQLCGGMFSGGGSDGSFRGKVYEPLIQELSGGEHTWYIDQDEDNFIPTDKLKEQATLLSELLQAVKEVVEDDNETMDDDTIVYQTRQEEEYTYKEVHDLMTLLRVAGERKAVMTVWY